MSEPQNPEWLVGRKMFMRKYRMQAGLCALCALPFAPEGLTRAHIIPRSKAGGTQWDNINSPARPATNARETRSGIRTNKVSDAPPKRSKFTRNAIGAFAAPLG